MSRCGSFGQSAWGSHCVAPVASVGVDGVGAEDFAVEVDDGDGVVVDEGEDAFASVLGADAEVVHAGGAAQAGFAVCADLVVADAVVAVAG